LRLELEPAPGDAEAFCDAEAFHPVLANLVDHAVK